MIKRQILKDKEKQRGKRKLKRNQINKQLKSNQGKLFQNKKTMHFLKIRFINVNYLIRKNKKKLIE